MHNCPRIMYALDCITETILLVISNIENINKTRKVRSKVYEVTTHKNFKIQITEKIKGIAIL